MFTKGLFFGLIGALALTACSGENTFKRESDPYKNYSYLTDNAKPYSTAELQQQEQKRLALQNKPCGNPFSVSIKDERGAIAHFVEEKEKTVTIRVNSILDQGIPWDVKLVEAPCDNCFKLVSKSQNEAVYNFTWNPPKGSSESVDGNVLMLRYLWQVEERCKAADKPDVIALNVRKENGSSLTFPGLKKDGVKFGDSFKFNIQINTSDASAPVLKLSSGAGKGELDATKAVDCEKTGSSIQTDDGGQAFVYACAFQSRLIGSNENDIKSLSGSGKSVDAVFTAKAFKSDSKSSKAFAAATAKVSVQFEKIERQAATDKKVQGDKK